MRAELNIKVLIDESSSAITNVATLALGLRPRRGLARVRAKREA